MEQKYAKTYPNTRQGTEESDTEQSASTESISTLLQLIWQLNPPKRLLFASIGLSLFGTIAGLVVPLLTREVVDSFAQAAFNYTLVAILAVAFVLQTAADSLSIYMMSYVGQKTIYTLREKLWNKALRLPVSYFDENQAGNTMSRITNDTAVIKSLITDHVIPFVSGFISIAGAVIVLFYLDWKMSLIMLATVPLSVLVLGPFGAKMYQISLQMQDELATFNARLSRVLSEIRLVKAHNAEQKEQEKGTAEIHNVFRFGMKEAKILALLSPIISLMMMVCIVMIIGYGGARVATGSLSAGTLVAMIIYIFQIILPGSQLANTFTELKKAVGATVYVRRILGEPSESEQAKPYNGCVFNRDESRDLQFKNVSFTYAGTESPVLQNVQLSIPSGKLTAFVGPSGSGKTTLFYLLARFYTPQEGTIDWGDTPIQHYGLTDWRDQLGYVSQESPLMSGTIRYNLCYGLNREVTEEEIRRVCELTYVTPILDQLEHGIHTQVGERGVKLSGGQRQRLALARALLRDPKILMLDEATSNLDSTSEDYIQQALAAIMPNRTTVAIAHRLSTILHADQIVVLEKGRITATGKHEQLLQESATYRSLYEKQFQSAETH